MNQAVNLKAYLYSAQRPDSRQEEGFRAFLRKRYQEEIPLEWIDEPELTHGFRLEVGNEVYDWSPEGLLHQITDTIDSRKYSLKNVVPVLKRMLSSWELSIIPQERGVVQVVGDGIAWVSGLPGAVYGEILVFQGGIRGM